MDRKTIDELTHDEVKRFLKPGKMVGNEYETECPICHNGHLRLFKKNGIKCMKNECDLGPWFKEISKRLGNGGPPAKPEEFEEASSSGEPFAEASTAEQEESPEESDKKLWPGLTLAELAKQKRIPQWGLEFFGAHEKTFSSEEHTKGKPIPTTCFPYGVWKDGEWVLTAVKVRGGGSHQTFFDKRTPHKEFVPTPFGLAYFIDGKAMPRSPQAEGCADIVICEGESDAITLDICGFPAIGISGAQAWHDSFADIPFIKDAEAIFIVCEPGDDGAKFASAVVEGLRDRKKELWIIPFPEEYKDPSELYVQCMQEVGSDGSVQYPERPEGFSDAEFGQYCADLATMGEWDPNPGKTLFKARIQALFDAHAQRYFRSTDTGNAERLVAAYGENFRYLKDEGIFVVWNGHKWHRDRTASQKGETLFPLTKSVVREKPFWTDKKWKESSESQGKRNAMVGTATGEEKIRAENKDFDQKPMLLYVANGVVDLETGKFREPCREDYVTRAALVSYEAEAQCPEFTEFIDLIFQNDVDTIHYMQKALGYTLTASMREQCFFMCYGLGSNGKSTLLTLMDKILGPDFFFPARFSTFAHSKFASERYELANFRGKRLVTTIEPKGAGRLDEEVLKQMTGGDMITARQIYGYPVAFYPEAKLWFAMNNKPRIISTDEGIWRRVRLIPFDVQIPAERKQAFRAQHGQKEFCDVLMEKEGPGILNWLIEGCLAWKQEGLEMSGAIKAATEAFRAEQNVFARFVEECCVEGKGQNERAGALYACYKAWCDENEEYTVRQNEFAEELQRRGYKNRKGGGGVSIWEGVALKGTAREPEQRHF